MSLISLAPFQYDQKRDNGASVGEFTAEDGWRTLVFEDIEALAKDWADLRLQQPAANFYQSVEWCSAWVDSCAQAGTRERLRIVTVWQGRRLVLLWPLSVRRLGPFRILHSLGEPATQYSDVLVAECTNALQWFERAWTCVLNMRGVDALHLKHVRADSTLERLVHDRSLWFRLRKTSSPFVLKVPDDEVVDGSGRRKRSGRSLNALKRHLKALKAHGDVVFEAVPTCEHVSAVLEALAMKADRFKTTGNASAAYLHPANEMAISAMAKANHFLMRRLLVAGETAAIEVGVLDRGRYYSMIQSYDQRYAAYSPGRLLLWHLLNETDEVKFFDFLPPNQPHKTEWTEWSTDVLDYVIPLTLRGRIFAFYLRHVRRRLVDTFNDLPSPLRRMLSRLKTILY